MVEEKTNQLSLMTLQSKLEAKRKRIYGVLDKLSFMDKRDKDLIESFYLNYFDCDVIRIVEEEKIRIDRRLSLINDLIDKDFSQLIEEIDIVLKDGDL